MDDYGNNCTNYAAFRLAQNGYSNPGNLGNAGSWAVNADNAGLKVTPASDNTPRVGDIAQWNYGHVAYVEWVSTDGTQFAVSETGFGPITMGDKTYPSMSGRGIFGGDGRHNESAWPDNFITFNGGPNQVTPADVSTALVIDSSGSMGSNDPSRRRLDAARAYLASSLGSDEVGVVDFDSSARTVIGAVPVEENRSAIEAAISTINSSGGTDLGAGLREGYNVLAASSTTGKERAAIFLTDGSGSYSNQAADFAAKGWKIFTFGLGTGVNESLLSSIASQTGGRYVHITSSTNLICEFQQVRVQVTGGTPQSCAPDGIILQGSTIQIQQTIPGSDLQGGFSGSVQQGTFTVTWPGSTIEMTLVSPSGQRYDAASSVPGFLAKVGPTYATFTVQHPEPGVWTIELYGADIPDGGEPYTFTTVLIEGSDITPPTIAWEGAIADGDVYDYSDTPAEPTCSAEDAESGVAPEGCQVAGYSTEVGTHTLVATAADNAGNLAVSTRSYEVLPWTLSGFFAPVRAGEATAKAGSDLPLKFKVTKGATELTSVSAIDSLAGRAADCTTWDSDEAWEPIDANLRYDMEEGQFVANVTVPDEAGCAQVRMTARDGSELEVALTVR